MAAAPAIYHKFTDYEGSMVINMGNKLIDGIALTIAIIGAVNWGLIGFFDFNFVASVFGSMSWISRIIYALVGICGLYLICFYMRLGNTADEA